MKKEDIDNAYKTALAKILPGDIILVEGRNKLSPKLIAAQKVFYANARSSHVMIHIGDGIVIHATGDKGVYLAPLFLELENCEERWTVIRNKKIADLDKDLVLKNTIQFYAQSYSTDVYKFKELKVEDSESSFCSELAHRIYISLGVDINLSSKRKLFPCDMDRLADEIDINSDWENVTQSYQEIFSLPELDEYKFAIEMHTLHMDLRLKKRQLLSKSREFVFGTALDRARKNNSNEMLETLDNIKHRLENRELKFWFDKDKQFGERRLPPMEELIKDQQELVKLQFDGMNRMMQIRQKYKK